MRQFRTKIRYVIPLTVKLSHFIRDSTSSLVSCRNSSLSTRSTKCFRIYFSAACLNSSHPWVSANDLIPKQFDGSSCCSKNSQHAFWTPKDEKKIPKVLKMKLRMKLIWKQLLIKKLFCPGQFPVSYIKKCLPRIMEVNYATLKA